MANTITAPVPPASISSIKSLAETPHLTSIPPTYAYATHFNEPIVSKLDDYQSLPIIDFSLLTSTSPHQRNKIIRELDRACEDWGFFMVVNHGVPESLMKGVIEKCNEFFNQTEEEKQEFKGKHVMDGIRCGTSFNSAVEKVFFWRDFLKVLVHPQFHSVNKPPGFSEILMEYCKETRRISKGLVKAISMSLGISDIEQGLKLDSGLQIFIGNFYPPCPQPELALGMPPHSDHALMNILIQNQNGLQIMHNGKWVNVNAIPNSILVNTGDAVEILSNGKYKSVLHRAVVNNKSTRISIATTHGPPLDMVIKPAPELLDNKNNPAAYLGMKYGEYLELQQSNVLDGKTCLDRVRI